MGQLLRHRRIGRGRIDWTAVRRLDPHCHAATSARGGSACGVCDPNDCAFQHRLARVGSSMRPVARDRADRRSMGPRGAAWNWIHRRRYPAHAHTYNLPTRPGGLAVSCTTSSNCVRDARAICIRGAVPCSRGLGLRWGRSVAATVHRPSQRLGCRRLPCVCQHAQCARLSGARRRDSSATPFLLPLHGNTHP